MAKYLARVELHRAVEADYEQLHNAMYERGFYRIVQGDNQQWYALPTGTYIKYSGSTLQDALNDAIAAANTTGKRNSLIVVDWNSALWSGLAKV